MKKYNCYIYIPAKNIKEALDYLKIRDVNYVLRYSIITDEYEIAASERFAKVLDRCSLRYNKVS